MDKEGKKSSTNKRNAMIILFSQQVINDKLLSAKKKKLTSRFKLELITIYYLRIVRKYCKSSTYSRIML